MATFQSGSVRPDALLERPCCPAADGDASALLAAVMNGAFQRTPQNRRRFAAASTLKRVLRQTPGVQKLDRCPASENCTIRIASNEARLFFVMITALGRVCQEADLLNA